MDGKQFLQALLELRGLNPHSMAVRIGTPALQSTAQRFLMGNQSRPSTMQPIADFFGVAVGGFYDPGKAVEELARLGAPVSHSNTSPGPAIKGRGRYPVVSDVQAGEWTDLCDNFQPGDAESWGFSPHDLGSCGYMLRVVGKSMTNTESGARYSFPEGMLLHINPDLEPLPGKFVVVRREADKRATFKRLVTVDGELYLEAINPDWPNRYLKLQPGDAWCGVVVDASFGNLP